jgi:hypothetical protein
VDDPTHLDRFAALIKPVPAVEFVSTICRWLQDAHEAAAELQPIRRSNHRGNWDNNTSFGTDRHQYLLSTAESLVADLPALEVDQAFQSVLLKLERVGIYQYHAPAGPYGSIGEASDLRRELFTAEITDALFSRADAWLNHRVRLFLPWSGTEELGLTDAWIGQGLLRENHISWTWLLRLQDVLDGTALTPVGETVPLDPAAFEQVQPMLPIKPRAERPAGSAG